MSRSNPTSNDPNPSTRWFEWDGENGNLRHFDKEKKESVHDGDKMTFILLDELATVTGYNDRLQSGLYSNEVRDTRSETMFVKFHKGGTTVAQGFYKDIRDKVNASGGSFTANLYIAYKGAKGALEIGSIKLKGAALSAWMEFKKANRKAVGEMAVRINGFSEHVKGKITYRIPVFEVKDITAETNAVAISLDKELQEFLKGYFARTRGEQVAKAPAEHSEEDYPQERGDFGDPDCGQAADEPF